MLSAERVSFCVMKSWFVLCRQVNYAARAAGVKKHMAPKEVWISAACTLMQSLFASGRQRRYSHQVCWLMQARNLLQAVGGVVHHVHMEAGGRVSYGPYRDVSKQLISRLRKFTGVGVIEKASIDECYIQYSVEGRHQDFDTMTAMQKAAQLAGTIRRTGTC